MVVAAAGPEAVIYDKQHANVNGCRPVDGGLRRASIDGRPKERPPTSRRGRYAYVGARSRSSHGSRCSSQSPTASCRRLSRPADRRAVAEKQKHRRLADDDDFRDRRLRWVAKLLMTMRPPSAPFARACASAAETTSSALHGAETLFAGRCGRLVAHASSAPRRYASSHVRKYRCVDQDNDADDVTLTWVYEGVIRTNGLSTRSTFAHV
jgi:hypothetical protein